MTYAIAFADTSNIQTADEGPGAINVTTDTFVVLDETLTVEALRSHFHDFQGKLRQAIHRGFSFSISNYGLWNPQEVKTRKVRREGDALMAFKPIPKTKRLQYFEQAPILKSCVALEVVSGRTPQGRPRQNAPKGGGGLPKILSGLPVETQRAILTHAFEATPDLDSLFKLGQGSSFALKGVEDALMQDDDAPSALFSLLPLVAGFMDDPARQSDTSPRTFGAALFFAYLAGQGLLLWPRTPARLAYLVPDILRPLWWEVLAYGPMSDLIRQLANARGNDRATAMLRRLMLTTDLFFANRFDLDRFSLLVTLKRRILQTEDEARDKAQHEINVLVRLLLKFTGRRYEDIRGIAANFGGGKRPGSPHAKAFAWVEEPKRGRVKHRSIFGEEPPAAYSEKVQEWAIQLRELLPGFESRSLKGKKDTLDYWLYFLTTLTDAEIPGTFREVSRSIHIVSSDTERKTFSRFVEAHGGNKGQRIIADLAQAWRIAAKTDNFSYLHNPIDTKTDAPGSAKPSTRAFHTRRLAMAEALIACVRAVNTRGDYAFARSLGRYNRKSSVGAEVFWPALPIIVEMIMGIGLRSHSAIWSDSGEGDEYWPGDTGRLRNPLAIATPGRQAGTLQNHEIDVDVWVLGLRLQVAKTGAYTSPWIDPALIDPIRRMRDWQIEHNPLRSPIPAVRDPEGSDFNPTYEYAEVYPLFRDPRSRTALPPTRQTVQDYWTLLLAAAEKEYNADRPTNRQMSFFREGKPLWDLHSLRVSWVTNFRDAGIPLEAIQYVTGHKSAAMAAYYDVHGPLRAHQALVRAKEEERDRIAAWMKDNGPTKSAKGDLETLVGGVVYPPSGKHAGVDMLRWALASGREVQVFSHGICPGARCDQGSNDESRDRPVFRPLACSRCQFRVTGARFVNGLAFRANALASEQFMIQERMRRMNRQLREAEDAGKKTRHLEDAIERLAEELDEVNKEWCIEYATCKLAEKKAREWSPADQAVSRFDAETKPISIEEVHPLVLLQGMLDASEIIAGGTLFVPTGAEETRNRFLYRISHHNNLDALLISVDPEVRDMAMHKFGQLITQHASSVSQAPSEYLEELIDGSIRLDPNLRIGDRMSKILAQLAKHHQMQDLVQ